MSRHFGPCRVRTIGNTPSEFPRRIFGGRPRARSRRPKAVMHTQWNPPETAIPGAPVFHFAGSASGRIRPEIAVTSFHLSWRHSR